MLKYQAEYRYGMDKEIELLPTLRHFFHDNTLQRNVDPFSPLDYVNETKTLFAELKSRKCRHDHYPTTMIGVNKIHAAKKVSECYFVFSFLNGTYFWKYNESDLAEFEKTKGGRCDRGCVEERMYYYIPIRFLSKLVLKK